MGYTDEQMYHDVQYVCKHYGNYRANKKTVERTTVSTKKNCPFTIKFMANKDGKSLQCTFEKDEHNHQLNSFEMITLKVNLTLKQNKKS